MERRVLTLAIAALLVSGPARADIASDRAAALVVYPVLIVDEVDNIDTMVELSNTSEQPATAHCFYVNARGFCSDGSGPCFTGSDCNAGFCIPGWAETDFVVHLTPRQPLAWRVSEGLANFPIDGVFRRGIQNTSNAGSLVPPMEPPFLGELKCLVVDEEGRPTDRNVLIGGATSVQVLGSSFIDVTKHNAIGIQAIAGANNGDNVLIIGEEYNACPEILVMDHYFDGADSPALPGTTITGALTLVPCTQDFRIQDQGLELVPTQFLIFNEFEQRFSTSTPVECYSVIPLSRIDTTQQNRSIFHVAVAGTLTGQTKIRGVGTERRGLLGTYFDLHGTKSSAMNLHYQGSRPGADIIRLP
jgi:hypothetical protein